MEIIEDPGAPSNPLTDREMDVLLCVMRGMKNKQIASALNISYQTAKNHISSIMKKCGCKNRIQIVVYALEQGWVKWKVVDG